MTHFARVRTHTVTVAILAICLSGISIGKQTSQPLYGILTQPALINNVPKARSRPSDLSASYIFKMYEQMVTAAGGMTMAIPYDLPIRKLNEVLPYLNGILIPGGDTGSKRDKEYSQRVAFIMHWAQARNLEGEHFSIIAIDKGLHELIKASDLGDKSLIECGISNFNFSRHLDIDKTALHNSKILKSLPEADMDYVLTTSITVPFSHNCSIPVEKFIASKALTGKYNLIATATKNSHPTFVALVEHKVYPFVGMQFRPDVIAYKSGDYIVKDRQIVTFYRKLVSRLVFGGRMDNLKSIDELPINIQNLLMYKDSTALGYHATGPIYIYRRWMAGRDIDIPTE